MAVDANWPVNRRFKAGKAMTIACDPIDAYQVPTGQDPQVFKERLIEEFCGASSQVRNDFIEGMSRWLGQAIG